MSGKLPTRLPFKLGMVLEFNYGHTAGTFTFPPEPRTTRVPAEARTHTIDADRRTA